MSENRADLPDLHRDVFQHTDRVSRGQRPEVM